MQNLYYQNVQLLVFFCLVTGSLTAQITATISDVAGFEEINLENESFNNGADNSGGFLSGDAFFLNNYTLTSFGGFWNGWAVSNTSDTTTAGFTNQYSAITGAAQSGKNYGVAFVSGSSKITFDNDSISGIEGLYVTNSTYAALSMLNGDSFAKQFGGDSGDDPDYFMLHIFGFESGASTDTIEFYLADYRFSNNADDYIVTDWEWVDLTALGEVDSLFFTLSSSDNGQFGMNTPAYFCADNVTIEKEYVITSTSATAISLYPNPTSEELYIHNGQPESAFEITNTVGNRIQSGKIQSDGRLSVRNLPAGSYLLHIHEQGTFPFMVTK